MSDKKRVFISSVQKELELERAAVSGFIATDPFLMQHCSPILFDNEHPRFRPGFHALSRHVVRGTAYRDIQFLPDLSIIERRGRRCSIRYALAGERT